MFQTIILLCCISSSFTSFTRNKYMTDIEAVFLCPDNNELEIPVKKAEINRINRTHKAVTIEFSLARPIDENIEASVIFEKMMAGRWVNIPLFQKTLDPCRKILKMPVKTVVDGTIDLLRSAGVKHPEKCDIPAGDYHLKDYVVNLISDNPFLTGRFRSFTTLRSVLDGKKIFCVASISDMKEVK